MDAQHNESNNPILRVSNAPAPGLYRHASDLPSYFGAYGGSFVPETLVRAHDELAAAYVTASNSHVFRDELETLGRDFVGRPTPTCVATRLSRHLGGAEIWLKREDLAHTGAHKINNALAQALVASRVLGKRRVIAETGAGQHGVATATACARLGLECVVYMGARDMVRQRLNVFRMRALGASVVAVASGDGTLKDAINAALRDWVTHVESTHYIIGSAIGPFPFPVIVRDFQSVIGREARAQLLDQAGKLPDVVLACVGGGSNAIGMFHPFVNDTGVRLIGVEAGGEGLESGKHSSTLSGGRPGVLHGTRTYIMQNEHGQVSSTHSVSAGLDYAGVGPEHAMLKDSGRAEYVSVTDQEALEGFQMLCRMEGIIPALETAHAIAYAIKLAPTLTSDQVIVVNVSGRGDKDMVQVAQVLGVNLNEDMTE